MKRLKCYKRLKNLQLIFIMSAAIGLILFSAGGASGQIVLLDSPIDLKPAEFYIAGVTDERVNKEPVAVLVERIGTNRVLTKTVDLQGGAAGAISRYIRNNIQNDRSKRAAVLGIQGLKLTETALPNGNIGGSIKLHLSLGIQKDYGVAPLTSSRFTLNYIRPASYTNKAETYIRSIIKTGLVYFNNWMKANENSDRRLAKSVKFSFSDYTEQPEGDTIYYSFSRPLKWADFQSHISSGKYQASVMPFIGYTQEAKISNGIIIVNIAMKAYLPKSASWANIAGRDDYALNHEQRHFDIAKIIAEQFKQKVLAEKLTPDTYEAFLNMQYFDSLRDLHAMQKAYDKETGNGINRTAQNEWNEKIDDYLKLKYVAN